MKKKPAPRRFGALTVFPLIPAAVRTFSALRLTMKPGAQTPSIYHRKTNEFFFILRGSAKARINGRSVRFKKGDFAFLPAKTRHQFEAGPAGVEVLDIFIPRLDLDNPDIRTVEQ
ncbi:MAG: cupin domain-containing protein [Elusimicrobia bacterium]|nr:cupin domain-containing protein [Elusimicrobiota bacterium]